MAPNKTPEQRKQDAHKRQQLAEQIKPLKKTLDQTDKKLLALNEEKSALETSLLEETAPAKLAEAGRQLKVLGESIETLEAQWLELTEQIEAASAG